MKIRQSLVSNSSSASFVILWRSLNSDTEDKETVLNILARYNDTLDKAREELKANTENLKSDIFETRFNTSMMNSMADFGNVAAHFFLELANSEGFEIIKARVEDHG